MARKSAAPSGFSHSSWKPKRATPAPRCGTATLAALHAQSSAGAPPVAAGDAPPGASSAWRAPASAGTCQTATPPSFSSRKSVRASSCTTSMLLGDEADEGQEQRAVEAVLVEPLGGDVGGRHHHHAAREQPAEQPAEDHGVGDVGDVELVEAQQRRFLGQRVGHRRDRIVALDLAVLLLLPPVVDAVVHVRP